MAFETPVLLIAFNRPLHTQKVLARIKEVKPTRLFVAIDGPRPGNTTDARKYEEVKQVIEQGVDWDCVVLKCYGNKNLGCGRGPAHAITWFFDQVEEGIILEDDCLPEKSFFLFCERMLHQYKSHHKILAVCGYNYFGQWNSDQFDYFFSDGGNWGWASWRRAWKLFDYQMNSWRSLDETHRNQILQFYPNFESLYQKIVVHLYDAWDIQWHYARLLHNGLSVTPSMNLVRNIGFDDLATHTHNLKDEDVNAYEMDITKKLKCPEVFELDMEYRRRILEKYHRPTPPGSFLEKILTNLKTRLSFS